MPFFMSWFFGLRIVAQTEPTMLWGGTAWFSDLTTVDSTLVLPVCSSLIFFANLEMSGRGPNSPPQSAMMKKFMRIAGVGLIPLGLGFPAAVVWYWVVNNTFTLIQTVILKQNVVRDLVGLPRMSEKAYKWRLQQMAKEAAGTG